MFIRDSFQNIKRNSLMSVASVLSVVAALIIIGVFLVFALNLNFMTGEIENNLELKVYLNDGLTQAQKDSVKTNIEKNSLCKSVTYESKNDALTNFKQDFGDKSYLLNGYEGKNNPLPESYIVKVTDSTKLKDMYSYSKDISGVKDVVYGEEVVDNLLKFNDMASVVCIVIFIVLSIVSIFIIYNTIKLTVYARRNDITVMKYVGATDCFIRFPFLIEGSILGLLGSSVSILIIRNIYYYVIGFIQGGGTGLPLGSGIAPPGIIMGQVTLLFIVYGIIIGAAGSAFSIRKFLDV
ncbi:permease-like cell division protein FtsX [uncultured Anaerofustis sp.]|uniref:permease-like cell division protein FtsX n=1 Tax=uncultured Anaerofustis sp. TaxID=904996 RepID=UPI0025EE19AF|nr:permease-like cell division protein FtsX [uncultured Anaerofustis sp.]